MKLSGIIALCLVTACLGAIAGYFIFYFTSSGSPSQDAVHSKFNGTHPHHQAALNGDVIVEQVAYNNTKVTENMTEKFTEEVTEKMVKPVTEHNKDLTKVIDIKLLQHTNDTDGKRAFDSLLQSVIDKGYSRLVPVIIEKEMNSEQKNREWTPLHWAVNEGRVDLIKILIENGADLGARNLLGHSPIHLATASGNVDVIKNLIESGDDINRRDRMNLTPLHWAVVKGNGNLVSMLLDLNADVNVKDSFKRTPLEYALSRRNINVIDAFKRKYDFDPLLQWTIENGDKKMLNTLIESEMIHHRKMDNWTTLNWAIYETRVDVVKVLLEDRGNTSLDDLFLFAIQNWNNREDEDCPIEMNRPLYAEHEKIIDILINAGAQKNCKDKENWTGLHWAVFRAQTVIADMLIRKGADVHCRDNNGKTARELAKNRTIGSNEIVGLLDAAEGKPKVLKN